MPLTDAIKLDVAQSVFILRRLLFRSRLQIRAFVLDLDRALRDLDRVRVRVLDLALLIDKTVNRYLSSGASRGLNQPELDKTCRFFLGQVFSDAITEILHSNDQSDWTAQFAAAFFDATGAGRAGHLRADPATMEATLRDAMTKLTDVLAELVDLPKGASWRSAMAERLRRNAGPVFARVERPTPEKATSIRMAALCLAAEADWMERRDIGDQFRQVAAGVTLLQRQATGERQAVEVVMLAVE